jgi:hypothetical protein
LFELAPQTLGAISQRFPIQPEAFSERFALSDTVAFCVAVVINDKVATVVRQRPQTVVQTLQTQFLLRWIIASFGRYLNFQFLERRTLVISSSKRLEINQPGNLVAVAAYIADGDALFDLFRQPVEGLVGVFLGERGAPAFKESDQHAAQLFIFITGLLSICAQTG